MDHLSVGHGGGIVPAHCTGWRAFTALSNACGDERVLMPSAVGRTFFF